MVDAMGMYFNLGNLNWGILGSNKLVKNHDSKIDGKKKERGENVDEEEYEKEIDESKIDGKKKERGEIGRAHV